MSIARYTEPPLVSLGDGEAGARIPQLGVCLAPGNRKPDCRSLNKGVYLFLKKKLGGGWSEAGWGTVVPSGVLVLPGILLCFVFILF